MEKTFCFDNSIIKWAITGAWDLSAGILVATKNLMVKTKIKIFGSMVVSTT